MDPLTTSALISGGSSILGSVIGGFGGSKNPVKHQQAARRYAVRNAGQLSEESGFHPLTVLQATTGSMAGGASYGGGRAQAVGNALSGAGEAAAGYFRQKDQKALRDAELQLKKALAAQAMAERAESMSRTANNYATGVKLHSDISRARQGQLGTDFNQVFQDGRMQPSNPIGIEEMLSVPFIDMYTQWERYRKSKPGDKVGGRLPYAYGPWDPRAWRK